MPDSEAPNPDVPIDTAQQLRRALAAVTGMREKLEAVEAKAREPIAIVGMACRFPGAPDLEAYWRLLDQGRDAITQVPHERWDIDALYDPDPDAPGKMSSRWGGFVDGVDRFDAGFFGISPREAVGIDPQQRLLLETAWHALEDAALPPEGLAGSRTGVYVGLSTTDYAQVLADREDGVDWIDAHASLGNSAAVAAGRLSYTLGLQGPAMVVDTACSSSLVSVHLAVQALRGGEIGLGLAAGVNLILSPELTIGFSKARMMAADGRCKTLDAAADGYVRGEGCGVVVLKRLSDALADGDRIHAVVLGSAVNQDGRSNGLTAPNGPAQAAVIRAALENAGIPADAVSYLEMHGTGTPLGDPIEARALASVFGGASEVGGERYVGSVKTNIGHLESAAGIAGLIKAALAAGRGRIPAHLNFHDLNPHIAADGFPFRVPTATVDWRPPGGRRIAGVSSFGFSGTNGHVIVAGPSAPAEPAADARPVQVLALSARDPEALGDLRAEVDAALADPAVDLAGLAATLAAGRSHHPHRLAVAAADPAAAREALAAAVPERAAEAPAVGFLFTGQGCQYPGMARGLLVEPAFRDVIERCDDALGDRLGRPLAALLQDADARLDSTALVQPLLFAVEVATAALWRSWGIEPAAVLGHSVGEVAAACVAGAVSVEDGVAFIAERGRLMQERAGLGGMAAVLAAEAGVAEVIQGTGAVVAASNGPASTAIAGDTAAMGRAVERLEAAGLTVQRLEVATAFHSPVLDPCLDGIERAADAVEWTPMRLPLASNLTGGFIQRFEAGYWRRQARGAVRFADGLRAVLDRGCRVLLEVGPHPVLSTLGRAIGPDASFLPSLKRGGDGRRMVAEALARLYALGAPVEWEAYHGPGRRRVPAPLYPFRRERFWPEPRAAAAQPGPRAMEHPLLGARIPSPVAATLYEVLVDTATMPFLADHVVFGEVVVPGAMHAVLGLAMAEAKGASAPTVSDLVFAEPLAVGGDGVTVQCVLEPDGGYTVNGLGGDGEWTLHASGRTGPEAGPPPDRLDLDTVRARLTADSAGPGALFAMLGERGIELGPGFRGLHAIWRGDGEALAEIVRPALLAEAAGRLPIHPAMLDSCFQLLGATFTGEGTAGGFLPLSVDRIAVWRRPGERFFCHARIADSGPSREVAVGHFVLTDAEGAVLAAIDGLQIKRVAAPAPRDPVADSLLAVEWVPAALPDHDWADPAALCGPAGAEAAARIAGLPESGLADGLERLAAAYAREALAALGAGPGSDPAAHGVQPRHARLYRRLFALADAADAEDAYTLASRQRAEHPDNLMEIDLVARCGAGLPAVLRGEADPLQLLFAEGSSAIYAGGGLAETANAVAAAALAAAVARRGEGQGLRVLEIGAGTGATTAALLPAVEGVAGAEYRFTDVSPGFLASAERTFAGRAGLRFEILDLEQDPAAQGFAAGAADVVVAANVVHATADLRQSLRHIRQSLAPGGLLILVESTAAQRWWDIVFGLTDGWWRFADTDLRPDHPLLPAERWRALLAAEGFAGAETVAADGEGRQSVILARAAGGRPLLAVHDGRDGPARDLADGLAAALTARGHAARALPVPEAVAALDDGPASVVYTGGVTAGVGAADQRHLRDAFELTRALAAGGGLLLLVTRGAQTEAAALDGVEGATLTGFGRVAALELPDLGCRRVDLDPEAADPVADLLREVLAGEMQADGGEVETAWRDGQRMAAWLAPHPLPEALPSFAADGSYLVTGGFGGLGPLLAAWLVEHGAGAVVLAGRREPDPAAAERLAALGPAVQARIADAVDEAAMTALLAEIDAGDRPLKGVFHLAGSVADGAIVAQDWDGFASVLPAKVGGARILDRLTRDRPLDHFVLFSTSASLIGNLGQANHAAANAYLDALARARRAAGLPGLSVNWGAWGEAGAVVEGAYSDAMAGRGVRPIRPQDGLDGLARAMAGDAGQVGFVDVDWPAFLAGYGERVPAYLGRFFRPVPVGRARRPAGEAVSAAATDIRARLADASPEDRRALLERLLLAEAAAVLGVADPSRIDPAQALNELGLDSLLALELRNRLSVALGETQPATLLFNYPSVAALAEHFAAGLLGTDPAAAQPEPARPAAPDYDAEIASMSDAELEALFDAELANLGAG